MTFRRPLFSIRGGKDFLVYEYDEMRFERPDDLIAD